MKFGKLIIFILILCGVVAGNALFKNRMVKHGIENALQQAFGAKAEVRGVRFDPIKGKLSFSHLEVANREYPMRNLFELGTSRLSLDTWQMLKGKVVIHTLESKNITWNTHRKTSGTLKKKTKKIKSNGKSQVQTTSTTQKEGAKTDSGFEIDAQALISSELTNLKTLVLISNMSAELIEITNRWTSKIRDTKSKVKGLGANVQSLRSVNVARIDNIQKALELKQRIETTIQTIDGLKKKADTVVSDVQKDRQKVQGMPARLQKSVVTDYHYLKSKVHLPEGGAKGLAAGLARSYLEPKLGKMTQYVFLAVDLALKNSSKKKDKKNKPEIKDTRRGSVVHFPTTQYPGFLIQNLKVSVKDPSSGLNISASLKNLSSDADLLGKPMVFSYTQSGKDLGLKITGSIDVRSNASSLLDSRIALNKMSFKLTEGLSLVQVKSVSGQAAVDFRFLLQSDGGLNGQVKVIAKNLKTQTLPATDIIGQIFADTLKTVPNASVDISYRLPAKGDAKIKAESNLDDILAKKVGEMIQKLVVKAEKELRSELNKQLTPMLNRNKALREVYASLDGDATWSKNKVNKYKQQLDQKKKEVEDRINAIRHKAEAKVKQKTDEIKKQATQQIQNATKNIKVKGLGF